MPDANYDWEDDARKCYALWIEHNRAKFLNAIPLCQCGKPLKTEDRGHHVVATCCGQVLAGCCGDG